MKRTTKSYPRSERINAQIQRELAILLGTEIKNPNLASLCRQVTLTAVELNSNCRQARIYYTLLENAANPEVAHALDSVRGFLRTKLAQRIRMRYIPELEFQYDESIIRGVEMERLIEDAVNTASAHTEQEADRYQENT